MAWVKKLPPVDLPKAFSDKGYKYSLKIKVSVTQSCLTLCDPKDCSPPGSSVHGIVQARILEWFAIPFSRGSSWPRDQTWVFYNAGRFLTTEPSLVAIILPIGNFSESWGDFQNAVWIGPHSLLENVQYFFSNILYWFCSFPENYTSL